LKIMLIFFAEEIQKEFSASAKCFNQFSNIHFVFAPIIRINEKEKYGKIIENLKKEIKSNITIKPIYLRCPNAKFSTLAKPHFLIDALSSFFKAVYTVRPRIVVCFYLSHAYPLIPLKMVSKFSLSVVAMGSDVNSEKSIVQRMLRKIILINSDLVFARSWALKDTIEKEQNCRVIVNPSSTDISFFKPLNSRLILRKKWLIDENEFVILTACRLDANKGVDILIKALSSLQASGHSNFRLLVAGDGEERRALEILANELGLQKYVKFLGYRSKTDLLELYNLSDVFVLASYSEGLPRAVIESMACGCIPIATDVGSTAVIVKDGFNGFLVHAGNPIDLSARIKQIQSSSKEEISLMQKRACYEIRNNFDINIITKRMLDKVCLLEKQNLLINA